MESRSAIGAGQREIKNQELSLHLLSESLLNEQQKLRQVLDWTHTFLSKGSEVHRDFCKAESLMLADKTEEKSSSNLSSAKEQHVSCGAGSNMFLGTGENMAEVWKLESNDPLCSRAKPQCSDHPTSQKDEVTWPKKVKSMELMDATMKQTLSQDNKSETTSKDFTSRCNSTYEVWKEREKSEHRMGPADLKFEKRIQTKDAQMRKLIEEQDPSPVFVLFKNQRDQEICKKKLKNSFEITQEKREMTSSFNHLKIPQSLTVYEQYQLCVPQLYNLGVRHREQTEPACFIKSPAQEEQTSEQTSPNHDDHKPLDKVENKISANKQTKKQSPDDTGNNKKTAALEHGQTKYCDNLRGRVKSKILLTHDGKKCHKLLKRMTEDKTSTDHPIAVSALEKRASSINNKGKEHNQGVKPYFSGFRGQKKKAEGGGASMGLCEKSDGHLASSIKNEVFQRLKSVQEKRQTERHQVKPAPACRRKTPKPTETQTALYDDPASLLPSVGVQQCDQTTYKYRPAGVTVGEHCLSLPDEVWLSILSLLPLRDLCKVMQTCRRLLKLASDHTLWRAVRAEDATLSGHWFLSVGGRHPRSLSLYHCSGPLLPTRVLEKFFTLCRNTLKEIQVTSCTGSGLRGDQIMSLVGQLCDHVTSVDVSWSGATDAGVKALSEGCPGLRLKSVVLNGCRVTDGPTINFIQRHKESLCRLEVFGCQFLTPSFLKATCEICPGLQHLNIGQVPKVNTDCLTVMTSQLKRLISLNLTGLQVVSDTTVDTLLQNCAELQSLTLNSCPGVTNLTLHSIGRYAPFIKCLDVSGCKAVTDAGVESLAVGCRRLQELDLSSTNTGNRGVDLLAEYNSEHLKTVKLSFCHISSENILKLCRRCKRLKVLHLYGCARVPTEREIRRVNAAVKVQPLP